ncbi:conserved hypothetical protein [Hyphomicrobiales bacterium]|nr:conserved hypothetical protein [Hyphomicrobiales bacterium]CAH1682038.1 conserved hypothetical protein [Hyphomicrobiales bacterium]
MPGQSTAQPTLPSAQPAAFSVWPLRAHPICIKQFGKRRLDKMIAFLAPTAIVTGLSLAAGILPASAQYYYDRPPGYDVPIPPAPVPEAPWARRPWAPPPGAYADDGIPRRAVEAMIARQGYSLESPLRRRGDVYVADVMDRRGTILRLTVDAYDGGIVSRRVIAEVVPDWDERPRPQTRWSEPGWDDGDGGRGYDSRDSGDRYATREPEPRVIPAPPMPKGIAPRAAAPKIPVPPARPSELQSDARGGRGEEPAAVPPVAQANPTPTASAPVTRSEPAPPEPVDIDPPDLPDVGPPSF